MVSQGRRQYAAVEVSVDMSAVHPHRVHTNASRRTNAVRWLATAALGLCVVAAAVLSVSHSQQAQQVDELLYELPPAKLAASPPSSAAAPATSAPASAASSSSVSASASSSSVSASASSSSVSASASSSSVSASASSSSASASASASSASASSSSSVASASSASASKSSSDYSKVKDWLIRRQPNPLGPLAGPESGRFIRSVIKAFRKPTQPPTTAPPTTQAPGKAAAKATGHVRSAQLNQLVKKAKSAMQAIGAALMRREMAVTAKKVATAIDGVDSMAKRVDSLEEQLGVSGDVVRPVKVQNAAPSKASSSSAASAPVPSASASAPPAAAAPSA